MKITLKIPKEHKGGPGSGNFGHSGRPGKIGGSAPSGGGRLMTPAQIDTRGGKQVKSRLYDTIDNISNSKDLIKEKLSEFNSPGLVSSYTAGIQAGMTSQGFNKDKAKARLQQYYDVVGKGNMKKALAGNIAESDAISANNIKSQLFSSYDEIYASYYLINAAMTEYGSPALRSALTTAVLGNTKAPLDRYYTLHK